MDDETFSIVQFFQDGSYEKVADALPAEQAVKLLGQLSLSIGGKLGTTTRIIIVDQMDLTCAEWIFGRGLVFPVLDGGSTNG
jgi:hypothetical protein